MGLGQSWRTFVTALKLSYEHIGKVMLTNLIWFFAGFAPFLAFSYLTFLQNDLIFIIAIIATFFTLGGATAGVQYRMNRVILGEDTPLVDMWEGFKRYFVKGASVMTMGLLGFLILVFNIWFSQNYPSTLFLILSGIWIWGIIFWLSMHQFVFPFLANQNIGVFQALKKSSLIVLDNPLTVLFMLVFSVIIVVLSLVLAAPLLIFMASFLALLQNCFYHELMVKYEVAEKDNTDDGEWEDKE